jgi:glutamine synthetase
VIPLNHGYQYLTKQRYDAIAPLMEILRSNLQELGLPLRSLEIEFGPSQVELTFAATTGMQPADLMVLFRNGTKHIFARVCCLANFMGRPQLPHFASSGWQPRLSATLPVSAPPLETRLSTTLLGCSSLR